MNLQEAQQALNEHSPCTYYSRKKSDLCDASTFYDVEIISVDADPTNSKITVIEINNPGFEIHITSENFAMLQPTSYMMKELLEVEYDTRYYGGNYTGVGNLAFIETDLVEQVGMEEAFRQRANIDPIHIIHFSENVTIRRDKVWEHGHTDW